MTKYRSEPTALLPAPRPEPSLGDITAVARAMGDEGRVRVLGLLKGGELCLCQIVDILGLAPSTVSKHMSVLRQAGLIEQRKEGRWHFYRLASGRGAAPMVRRALKWVMSSLENEPTVAADAKRLCGLCRKKPAEWTKCYRGSSAQETSS